MVFRKFKCSDLLYAEYKRRALSQHVNIVARDSYPIDSAFLSNFWHEKCPRVESVKRFKFVPRTIINAIKCSVLVLHALHVALSSSSIERVILSSRTTMVAIIMAIISWIVLGFDFVVDALSFLRGDRVPRGLSLVFVQHKGKSNAEYSKIIVEKYNIALNCFDKVSEIQIWERTFFGILLLKNKVFVLGGHNRNGYLKSVSTK